MSDNGSNVNLTRIEADDATRIESSVVPPSPSTSSPPALDSSTNPRAPGIGTPEGFGGSSYAADRDADQKAPEFFRASSTDENFGVLVVPGDMESYYARRLDE